MSADPVQAPDVERLRLELAILDALVRRQPVRWVAKQHGVGRDRVGTVGRRNGHPDREAMRRAAARLRSYLAHIDAGTVPEQDDPAVEEALRLSAAARDLDPRPFAALLARPPAELVQLITVYAGIVSPDTDPGPALDWADAPADSWTDETVAREAARWLAGARDRTAVAARQHARV